jgi:Chitobiase/beta-hexosaminidase C-terminal domain
MPRARGVDHTTLVGSNQPRVAAWGNGRGGYILGGGEMDLSKGKPLIYDGLAGDGKRRGEMAERLNAPDSKSGIPSRVSGVQIPLSPPVPMLDSQPPGASADSNRRSIPLRCKMTVWKFVALIILSAPSLAHAGTTIPAGSTQAEIQTILNSASPANNVIQFAAGTYNLTDPLIIPCSFPITISGPTTTPATAILNPSFTNKPIFNLTNCVGLTIQYLNFTKTQSIKLNLDPGIWCTAGCVIAHNQFTGLTAQLPTGSGGDAGPACDSGTGPQGNCDSAGDTAITFASNSGAACPGCAFLTNTQIVYNQFGDASSCLTPADVMDGTTYDYGGNCAGIQFYTAINGVTVNYNNFIHLEEGFHVLCGPVGGDDCSGPTAWTWKNFTADYNDFSGIHRIGAEMQLQGSANIHVDHNSYHSPIAPFFYTFAISNACCAGLKGSAVTAPGITNVDDVLIAEQPASTAANAINYIGMADEAWGTGAQYTTSVVQGNWQNGYEWAYITGGSISHNVVCGSQMAAAGTLIHHETNPPTSAPPTQIGNTTGASCGPVTSTAPRMPASMTFTGSQTVTLADNGSNTGIWYTTDGSTPVPGQGTAQLYKTPLVVSATTTIKAVGMWGTANQPKSYPAGYGYVPSAVVSSTYTASSARGGSRR